MANPERDGIWVDGTLTAPLVPKVRESGTLRQTVEQVTRGGLTQNARQRETKVPRCSTPGKRVMTPNEQAPRNEREKEWKNVHTRSDADQRSPQVTKHGHGKLRAGKQQQQDGRARNGSEEEQR